MCPIKSRILAAVSALVVLVIGAGCETYTAADPDAGAPFFEETWYDAEQDWSGFTEVVISPVKTELLAAHFNQESGERQRQETADKIATLLRLRCVEELSKEPARFRVVEEAGPQTLIVDLGIVEIHPARPIVDTALDRSRDDATVELVGQIRSGGDGRVLAKLRDRRTRSEIDSGANENLVSRVMRAAARWSRNLAGYLVAIQDGRMKQAG